MNGYTPTTDEVRDSLVYLNKNHAKQYGDVDLLVVGSETAAQFDRMIAEVRRQAAEEAWDEGALWAAVECGAIATENAAWIAPGDNPYRAEAYRGETIK